MPRPSQLLYPQREPAPTRPAATVLLLHDAPAGLEVLMTRRSLTASFAPGAYVFPGGGIGAADAAAHPHATRRPTQSDEHLTQAIAAIRESFEELGVLLARHADGAPATAAEFYAGDQWQNSGGDRTWLAPEVDFFFPNYPSFPIHFLKKYKIKQIYYILSFWIFL